MLNYEHYVKASEILRCETAAIRAVAEVESSGSGFLADGKPKILFEPFIFGRRTKGRFNGKKIIILDTYYPISLTGKWSPLLSKYGGEEIQYFKLRAASELDETEALKSCSWGKFQIMGFNHLLCGYSSVHLFVDAMCDSEEKHLDCFISFILNTKINRLLAARNWRMFALRYNGKGAYSMNYPQKLESAYKKFKQTDQYK